MAARIIRRGGIACELVHCDSWQQLHVEIQRSPVAVIVCDPYCTGSLSLEDLATVIRGSHSDVLVYADFRGRPVGTDITAMLDVGVEQIRTYDVDDDPENLAEDVLHAVGYREHLALVELLPTPLTPSQRVVFKWAMRFGWRYMGADDLAHHLGMSSRTLRRRCERMGGLSAGSILRWGRVLYTCRLLSATRAPASLLTTQLGYSSHSEFCRQFRRLTGVAVSSCGRSSLYSEAVRVFSRAVEKAAG